MIQKPFKGERKMIEINQDAIEKTGGILAAISYQSANYLQEKLNPWINNIDEQQQQNLYYLIAHRGPHLDEYWAELLFRAALPEELRLLTFKEQALHSEHNDLVAEQYWPYAAVFGMGETISAGQKALLLIDEHPKIGSGKPVAPSCAEMVANRCFSRLPSEIQLICDEVNAIDASGGAHPQHLGNLIKTMHNTHFVFHNGDEPLEKRCAQLPSHWKRALVNACLAAAVYALENDINLFDDKPVKSAMSDSLNHYLQHSLQRNEPEFDDAAQNIKSNFNNIKTTIDKAQYQWNGKVCPQRLLLPQLSLAMRKCWGDNIAKIVMLHFWETEMQQQISFLKLQKRIKPLKYDQPFRERWPDIGELQFSPIPSIVFEVKDQKGKSARRPLWLFEYTPNRSLLQSHKAIMHLINNKNYGGGVGLILLHNSGEGTNALFSSSGVPYQYWQQIADSLSEKDKGLDGKDLWHKQVNQTGDIARFLLNGNSTHQYVVSSRMKLEGIKAILGA
jgi:hypothetical protein